MIDLDELPGPEWWRAIQWFDNGDPSVIAEMIVKGEAMPLMVRKFVAEIIIGKRRPPSVGRGRKILNVDHKERLRVHALNLRLIGPTLQLSEKRVFKEAAISEVVALSGASIGTVRQAWKEANTRFAQIDRRNRTFLSKLKQQRQDAARIERLSADRRKVGW